MNGAWLDIEQVRKKFKTDTFGLPKNQIQANDSIQIRLVREITEWLDRPITEASQASVQFKLRKIGLPNCESFEIEQKDSTVLIWASGSVGHLYGFYELIRKKMLGISDVATVATPDQPIRMINQWDQTDGSIERGYAGASILFGALRKANQMMEFELSAEYLGHQIVVNYAVPQWAHMIRTNTQFADLKKPVVAEALAETAIDQKNTGFAAVANVGMSPFWAGNPLALANLYGYGRLCWGNFKEVHEILTEWIEQSFSTSLKQTKEIIFDILATSNETYKNYTAPLGVGFMVVPHYHYGVSINGYEYDRWGTYHFADRNGVGVDRTAKTGTGFTKMYAPKVAARYEDPKSTPKDLLLFFHHLPYDFKLSDGNTLIQTIYDNHFAGYTAVQDYLVKWRKVAGDIDEDVYQEVLKRLSQQSQNALEWRDQVNTYFYRMSGIPDKRGRQIYQ